MNSCSFDSSSVEDKAENEAYDKIISEATQYLHHHYEMEVSGLGSGTTEDNQRIIIVNFDIFKSLTKEEIRQLVVDTTEKFIEIANSNELIRPYLTNFPFTYKNLKLFFISYLSRENKETPLEPYFSDAYLSNGNIIYLTSDPDNIYKFNSRTIERYEEALKILQKENMKRSSDDINNSRDKK